MSARICFCGCGEKVKRRHVPYNQLGVEMAAELAEWQSLGQGVVDVGLDFGAAEEFLGEGEAMTADLAEYMHTGTLPESLDLKRAGMWNQFSRKERAKLTETFDDLVEEAADANPTGGYADEQELDYTGVLSPATMVEHLADYMVRPIGDDREALLVGYLRESFEVMESSQEMADFLLTLAWAGYCTRSITIDEVPEARDESALTKSLLEFNQKESGDPMFVAAIGLAASAVGLGDRPLEDPILRASWIAVPGIAVDAPEDVPDPVDQAIAPFEALEFASAQAAVGSYTEEEREKLEASAVDGREIRTAWLLGYFLRVSEQYSPVPDVFAGASAYVFGE